MTGPVRPTVAITGAGGRIGQLLLAALAEQDPSRRLLAFDRGPVRGVPPAAVVDPIDIRDPALVRRLAGVDALVHLAWVEPTPAEPDVRAANVDASQALFGSAAVAGVRKVVYLSSAMVYGAHPDNEVPLTEASSLRANLDLPDAAQRLEVEYVLAELAQEFRDRIVTVLRPAPILGRGIDNAWSRLLELPFLPAVRGHAPPLQFVHESDVAGAIAFVLGRDLPGAYNVASSGTVEPDDVAAIAGRARIEVPESMLFATNDGLWRTGLSDVPSGLLHYLMHPWFVSPAKLGSAGWSTAHSSEEALLEGAARARPYVRIGGRRIRRSHLASGALGLGIAGALAGAGLVRRRRELQAS